MHDLEHKKTSEPQELALLPLKNVVLLPRSIRPIVVGRAASIKAVEHALQHDKTIFISAQRDPETEQPTPESVHACGTRATIVQVMRMPKGALKILVEGMSRARIISSRYEGDHIAVTVEDLPTHYETDLIELQALWRHLQSLYLSYAELNQKAPAELMQPAHTAEEMDELADTIAAHIATSTDDQQNILEETDLYARLTKLCALIKREIDILETEERIRGHVQTQVEKNQREYYLTEQIKAIQKELGRDDQQTELAQLKAKIKLLHLSPEALEKVEKELRRLEQMPPLSSEAVISRSYIDWIISLPWQKITKDTISLDRAEEILNQNHAGLKKAKERIIEFLAAKKFSSQLSKSPIICLVGPPGVGKTSLARSIAESLGREFVRISLGGVRDEAEIRGHRRTYIGSMPGKIVQAMKKAGSSNPVILLDEIDKTTSDVHGDPSSALLEVLDPEQNKSFVDHYLEVEYDLSKAMFIATANHMEGIPYPLFDRMEIITLSGYTDDEKIEIAQQFLIPKDLKEYGLKARQFKLPQEILTKLISDYTKEAGVRQLERLIAKLMRKTIQVLLKDEKTKSITVTDALLKEWLGNIKYKKTQLESLSEKVGLVTGLAWTEFGGDVLEIEAAIIPGKGGVTLTGQLGEVMQESAHAALSYIRSRSSELHLPKNFHSTKDIHLHIPEGATPKDGPSAGISMCVALVSALTKNPVRSHLAMTGEITLRGRILGVGGLKEKILAARQHGIKTVLLPKENLDDVEEINAELGSEVTRIFVENMDEVLRYALVKDPFNDALSTTASKNRKTNSKEKKVIRKKRMTRKSTSST